VAAAKKAAKKTTAKKGAARKATKATGKAAAFERSRMDRKVDRAVMAATNFGGKVAPRGPAAGPPGPPGMGY
jgi:hypothetical protein